MEQLTETQTAETETGILAANGSGRAEARPCFFHRDCNGTAEMEKQGKAVCRKCAATMNGIEYPLRAPSREPLYRAPEELAKQLGMRASKRKRGKER